MRPPPLRSHGLPPHSAACAMPRARGCPRCEAPDPESVARIVDPWLQVWPLHTNGPVRGQHKGPLSPGMVRRPEGGPLDYWRMGDLAAIGQRIRESGWDAEPHATPDTDPQRSKWRGADEYLRRKLATEDDIMGRTT